MSCGSCSEKTKAGASSAIGSPVATGGASNVRHCPQCGGFLLKDGQCRKCATAGSDENGASQTTSVDTLHEQAMDLAERAFRLQKEPGLFVGEEHGVFLQSLGMELQAAKSLPVKPESEPTRSILYRSASFLACHSKAFITAKRLAADGLSGHPPAEVQQELTEAIATADRLAEELGLRGAQWQSARKRSRRGGVPTLTLDAGTVKTSISHTDEPGRWRITLTDGGLETHFGIAGDEDAARAKAESLVGEMAAGASLFGLMMREAPRVSSAPHPVGGASNVRHCPQCGGLLPKDGQCRKCATAGSDGVNPPRNSQEPFPIWVQRWRELGDDMPCPECGEEQLETQDGLTACRACNWHAKNPLAIEDSGDEFGHGVTEAVSAQEAEAQDQGDGASFKLTAVTKKQWKDWVRQAKSSDTLFADDEYRPEALVINTQEAVGAVPQVLEEIAIAYKAHCDSCVVWINNPDDEVCIYQDHAEAVAQLAPQVGTTEDEWWDAVDEGIRGAAGRGSETATISMWLPGGSMQSKTLAQAHQSVRECWDTPQGFYWERRESGVDPEETWNDGSHEYTTLREVVTAALPHWKELGLTPEQAGLIAMETGLVVSTGVEIEDEEAEETD